MKKFLRVLKFVVITLLAIVGIGAAITGKSGVAWCINVVLISTIVYELFDHIDTKLRAIETLLIIILHENISKSIKGNDKEYPKGGIVPDEKTEQ